MKKILLMLIPIISVIIIVFTISPMNMIIFLEKISILYNNKIGDFFESPDKKIKKVEKWYNLILDGNINIISIKDNHFGMINDGCTFIKIQMNKNEFDNFIKKNINKNTWYIINNKSNSSILNYLKNSLDGCFYEISGIISLKAFLLDKDGYLLFYDYKTKLFNQNIINGFIRNYYFIIADKKSLSVYIYQFDS